jgi:hypothetical protein
MNKYNIYIYDILCRITKSHGSDKRHCFSVSNEYNDPFMIVFSFADTMI